MGLFETSLTCQNDSLFSVLEYDAKFFPSGEKAQAVISALCAWMYCRQAITIDSFEFNDKSILTDSKSRTEKELLQ